MHITKSALIIYDMWCVSLRDRLLHTDYPAFDIIQATRTMAGSHRSKEICFIFCVCMFCKQMIFDKYMSWFIGLRLHLCIYANICLPHPSLVQSFVGSLWTGRSRAALMSSMASSNTFIASPMWSCWWDMLMCMATCCPLTMTTTTTKPSPQPTLYSGCSCRGKVSTSGGQQCFFCKYKRRSLSSFEQYIIQVLCTSSRLL